MERSLSLAIPPAFANTAIGDRALFSNNATGNGNGNGNTAIGNLALSSNTTGGANTAVGQSSAPEQHIRRW